MLPKGPEVLLGHKPWLLLERQAGRLEKAHVPKRPSKAWAFIFLQIWGIYELTVCSYYQNVIHVCSKKQGNPTSLSLGSQSLVGSTIPSSPQSEISLHQPSRSTTSAGRYVVMARTLRSVRQTQDVRSSSLRLRSSSCVRENMTVSCLTTQGFSKKADNTKKGSGRIIWGKY